MKLEMEFIRRASQAGDEIRSIDRTIESMGRQIEANADTYGEKIRDIFGRNTFSQFRNSYVGEVAFCAIVNALLDKRAELVSEFSEVEFTPPPCPRQTPNSED